MTCRIASCYASHCWRYYSEFASHAPCRQRCCQQRPVSPATSPAMLRVASEVASDAFCHQQCRQRHPGLPATSPAILRVASDVASDAPYCQQRSLPATLYVAGDNSFYRWRRRWRSLVYRWQRCWQLLVYCWQRSGEVAGDNCWVAGNLAISCQR